MEYKKECNHDKWHPCTHLIKKDGKYYVYYRSGKNVYKWSVQYLEDQQIIELQHVWNIADYVMWIPLAAMDVFFACFCVFNKLWQYIPVLCMVIAVLEFLPYYVFVARLGENVVTKYIISCLPGLFALIFFSKDLCSFHFIQDKVVDHITDGIQIDAQRIDGDVGILADDVDGIVCERDVFGVEDAEVGLFVCLRSLVGDDVIALKRGEHPVEDHAEAHAARVHDAGLFQDRILIDRVFQRGARGGNALFKDVLDIRVFPGKISGRSCGQTRDGQDGALGGLHDGLIGGLYAGRERGGEIAAVGLMLALPGR